jgi:TRAP-type mannitol/chloroaromatic compound transport system permease large subunit
MFRGVIPFILLQILTLAIVAAYPPLVLWLPTKLLGFQ